MATNDELTQQINTLTILVNSILSNSGTITSLPNKAIINGTEELPINGEEKITVQQIIDKASVSGDNAYTVKIANYTLTSEDSTVECLSNSFTISLPTAVGIQGKKYDIKNSGNGTITIDAFGTETIDDELTQSLTMYDSITVMSNSANWIII